MHSVYAALLPVARLQLLLPLLALSFFGANAVQAQTPPPQAILQQANQMIFQGRTAAASAAERHVEAVEAYERAHELSGGAPGLALPLGSAVAMTGDLDRAFELLRDAEESGQVDITSVGGMPAAGVLSADPR